MTRRLAFLGLPLFVLTLVACGDDDASPARAATATKGDAFCVAAAEVETLSNRMGEVLLGGDTAASEAALEALVASAEATQKIAPTDIEASVTKSVSGLEVLLAGLKKFNFDFEAASADTDFVALMEDPEVEAAGDEVDLYLEEKCGLAAD